MILSQLPKHPLYRMTVEPFTRYACTNAFAYPNYIISQHRHWRILGYILHGKQQQRGHAWDMASGLGF